MNKSLDELKDILMEDGYLVLGHGTGRSKDNKEVVTSIFENGLRTKDNSLYYTTIGLDIPDIASLKTKLNNWPHFESKNIILIRVPIDYINIMGESADLDCERFGAFMIEKIGQDNEITYYLNPKFIIGNYDTNSDCVLMNEKFEEKLSDDSKKELNQQLKKTLKRTEKRLKRLEESSPFNDSNIKLK